MANGPAHFDLRSPPKCEFREADTHPDVGVQLYPSSFLKSMLMPGCNVRMDYMTCNRHCLWRRSECGKTRLTRLEPDVGQHWLIFRLVHFSTHATTWQCMTHFSCVELKCEVVSHGLHEALAFFEPPHACAHVHLICRASSLHRRWKNVILH